MGFSMGKFTLKEHKGVYFKGFKYQMSSRDIGVAQFICINRPLCRKELRL